MCLNFSWNLRCKSPVRVHIPGPDFTLSGNAAVDIDARICIVDNVLNGFDAYKLDCGTFIQDYRCQNAMRTHPKGVALARKSTLVVGGSDHGKVYIFERKTGGLLKTLNHNQTGGAETIAVCSSTPIPTFRELMGTTGG